jgi:hypothetical protein
MKDNDLAADERPLWLLVAASARDNQDLADMIRASLAEDPWWPGAGERWRRIADCHERSAATMMALSERYRRLWLLRWSDWLRRAVGGSDRPS